MILGFVKSIESFWRHKIVYPILRSIIHNPQIEKPIDILSIKKLLILRYDRIGDMIITTPIFRNLKQMNPKLKIGVFANKTNAEIIKNNPYIDAIYIFPDHWWQLLIELRKMRKEKFDVVINFVFTKMTLGGILINLIAPIGIKIGLGENKYQFYYNRLLSFERDKQIMVVLLSSLIKEAVGVDILLSESSYEIIVDEKAQENVQEFLAKYKLKSRKTQLSDHLPYLLFNLSASDLWTRFSVDQVESLTKYLEAINIFRTVVIYAPYDKEMKKAAIKAKTKTSCLIFPEQGAATLLEIAALVENAHCVITPDTSTVHFASAMQTPMIGFYSSAKEKKEWLPFQVKYNLLMSDNYLPISAIPIPKMLNAIDDFICELDLKSMNK